MEGKKIWAAAVRDEWLAIKPEELIDPGDEVKEGDTVIGEMSLELRQLYTYKCRLAGLLKEKTDALAPDDDEKEQEVRRLRRKYDAIENMFWASVCDEFPELSGKAAYGIRGGFKVVWFAEEESAISARIIVMSFSVELPLTEILRSMRGRHR